jgi:hypothetical protein
MVWHCPQCSETNEPQFEVCWQCGATLDGRINPEFRPQVDLPPAVDEPDWTPPQYGLAQYLLWMTCVAIVVWVSIMLGTRAALVTAPALIVLVVTEDRTRGWDAALRARLLGLEAVFTMFLIYRAAR